MWLLYYTRVSPLQIVYEVVIPLLPLLSTWIKIFVVFTSLVAKKLLRRFNIISFLYMQNHLDLDYAVMIVPQLTRQAGCRRILGSCSLLQLSILYSTKNRFPPLSYRFRGSEVA